uniref:Venom allergen-1 n=1 Tax=Corethrella appendiculata TaxID=1370023 RepID=U5EZT9_9DIPT
MALIKSIFLSVSIIFELFLLTQSQTDYCDKSLCPNGLPHVACGKVGEFGPACPADKKLINMTEELKVYILDLHNKFRARVASGQVQGFEPATKMPTLVWDDELQYLSELNVKTCIYGHDPCRNTAKYKLVGQNIAANSFFGMDFSPLDTITELITSWCGEYENANQQFVDNYPGLGFDPPRDIGHFAQIASDRTVSMACAMVQYTQNEGGQDWVHQNFVCDYSSSHVRQKPVYEKGPTCTKCITGCNPVYPGLCNIGEPVAL